MNKTHGWWAPSLLVFLLLVSCTSERPLRRDLINDPFPEAQAELREVVESILKDAMTSNIEGLQAAHLDSGKFTKFGPRIFDRQDVAGTNESEAAHFGSISDFRQETREFKIDVFGDVGIATYHSHVSFVKDGEERTASGRQTLVFVKTVEGWKIVHEHGTIRR